LASSVTTAIKELTGFDYVALSRIDGRTAEIIAEEKRSTPEHLRSAFFLADTPFPNEDGPLANPMYAVADVNAVGVPVVVDTGHTMPTSQVLSHSSLRCPTHPLPLDEFIGWLRERRVAPLGGVARRRDETSRVRSISGNAWIMS